VDWQNRNRLLDRINAHEICNVLIVTAYICRAAQSRFWKACKSVLRVERGQFLPQKFFLFQKSAIPGLAQKVDEHWNLIGMPRVLVLPPCEE